ncbi:toxin glutamine deamidase domain-containing protein [Streptomyces sp. NPDC057101]|uniref:toxin glutamine deamidase domain-containing protein n=1 Tax=Streptomyces sp. NPDC057101 TaxID=3346020 RepID=UPI00363684D6
MTQPTNTYGLNDNCYYCVAAFLSGRTAHDLLLHTGQMQEAGGAQLDHFAVLLRMAGLNDAYVPCADADAVEDQLANAPAGRYAVLFERGHRGGHAVVAIADGKGNLQWHDPQSGSMDPHTIWDVDGRHGSMFHIYGPN